MSVGIGKRVVDEVDLVPKVAVLIASYHGPVGEPERLSTLLSEPETRAGLTRSVTQSELFGICERVDRRTELFSCRDEQVLVAVEVVRLRSTTGRRHLDGRKARPSNSGLTFDVQDAAVDPGFVETVPRSIPFEPCHSGSSFHPLDPNWDRRWALSCRCRARASALDIFFGGVFCSLRTRMSVSKRFRCQCSHSFQMFKAIIQL